MRNLVSSRGLHTVCEGASCPNIGECWGRGTATFMILGGICTRNCRFCDVPPGEPEPPSYDEPARVADAIRALGLRHAVITSVTRDDLSDGGAALWAETIHQVRAANPDCRIEVLVPDFQGDTIALQLVFDARPDIFGHNLETIARLYAAARPQAIYWRSLKVLQQAKQAGLLTKSGVMLGMGETFDEILAAMQDLRNVGCDLLSLGQYLQPTVQHIPIERYWTPEEFEQLRDEGERLGFQHVEAGPLVRSSYHADQVEIPSFLTKGVSEK
ncbi:lipoic acid synthetase [Candidatus Moduliflexus flocculans]|uniref:Lipoyl synthase n=1 Tax=Candidatus Moduliflexus flocculans TaxID=1499966 RepID=A0A081BLR1_9BACT|nr:lipoic acid synthetase [Candidatus Moduliflexus flocculans]